MKTYRWWNVVEEMPEGWVVDRTAGSPLYGHVFITNGKSYLNGQERMLLCVVDRLKGSVNETNNL